MELREIYRGIHCTHLFSTSNTVLQHTLRVLAVQAVKKLLVFGMSHPNASYDIFQAVLDGEKSNGVYDKFKGVCKWNLRKVA